MLKVVSDNCQIKTRELQALHQFKTFSPAQLEAISGVMVRRRYAPGQLIFLEGDPSSGIWFVLKGRVKIIKQSLHGRLQGLCFADSGKCFGSCPLFDSGTYPANAQSQDEVTIAVLPHADLERLIYEDVSFSQALLRLYHGRLALLASLGESLGFWPVSERINACLLAHSTPSTSPAIVHLTHEEIAVLVGTAREVVTRHLSQLENDDLIETYPGRIILANLPALETRCLA